MTRTYRLTTIEHAVEIGIGLTGSWFRGHATVCGELTPKIHRANYNAAWKSNKWFECQLIKDFQRLAIPMMPEPFEFERKLRWIFLMQHHGAPTRLLDWTESVLVALYFAVQAGADGDGELWAMRPERLNANLGVTGVPCADTAEAKEIVDLFDKDPCDDEAKVEYPLAIRPAMHFPRMAAQLSTFTVHPRRSRTANSLTTVLTNPEELVRYVIPGGQKEHLRRELKAVGIAERTLFWDLDALSRSLTQECESQRSPCVALPQPPPCDGVWQ